jgi:methylated-DNA-[protein]-cysteine S-methyltransferase
MLLTNMRMKTIQIQYYHSPAGELILGSFEDELCLCDWMIEKRRDRIDLRIQKMLDVRYIIGSSAVIEKAVAELDDYFARRSTTFDIPLLFVGTDFQKRVWNKLLEIPYGHTVSYGEMARQLGCPKAVRAVANANGANALSIFAPCHRVIGSNSRLVGYAGGLEAKRILLELEG